MEEAKTQASQCQSLVSGRWDFSKASHFACCWILSSFSGHFYVYISYLYDFACSSLPLVSDFTVASDVLVYSQTSKRKIRSSVVSSWTLTKRFKWFSKNNHYVLEKLHIIFVNAIESFYILTRCTVNLFLHPVLMVRKFYYWINFANFKGYAPSPLKTMRVDLGKEVFFGNISTSTLNVLQ